MTKKHEHKKYSTRPEVIDFVDDKLKLHKKYDHPSQTEQNFKFWWGFIITVLVAISLIGVYYAHEPNFAKPDCKTHMTVIDVEIIDGTKADVVEYFCDDNITIQDLRPTHSLWFKGYGRCFLKIRECD